MAEFELSTAAVVTSLTGTEKVPVHQAGVPKAATVAQIAAMASAGDVTLSGDVSGTGTGAITVAIGARKVTYGKMVAATQKALIGAHDAGDFGEVTIGAGLDLSAGRVLSVTGTATLANGDYGDITVSSGGTVMVVKSRAITFAKIQAAGGAELLGAAATGNSYGGIAIGAGLSLGVIGGALTLSTSAAMDAEGVRDTIAAALVGGSGISITPNDAGDTIQIACTVTSMDAEGVRDTIAAALRAGTGVTIDVNDALDTITINVPSAGGTPLTAEDVRDTIGAALVAGTGIGITVNDPADTITIATTGGAGVTVADRTALAAISGPSNNDIRYLIEAGREGWFKFSTSSLTTEVTNDPNQGVYVPPAAATSGSSGAWVRVWSDRLNVKWFGATGDGTTNDLTACQRAVNLAVTLLAAEVHFPRGVYSFGSGTLSAPAYSSFPLKVLKLTGDGAMQLFGTVGTASMGTTGTILKSTSTTSTAAVVQVTASSGSFSSYALYVEDMTIRTYDNPLCHGLDAGWAQQLLMRNVQIDTGIYSVSGTNPTSTTSTGLITPKNNNAALTECANVSVSGYFVGIQMNEHAHFWGANVTGNGNALFYQFGNHASYFNGHLQNNTQNFVIGGACLFRAEVNIEHATSGWQVTTADIKDVGSLAIEGEIVWSIVQGGVGQDTGFLRTGGNNIADRRVGVVPTAPISLYAINADISVTSALDTSPSFTKISGGNETSLHSGDATKIDINVSGTYRVTINGAWAANATGQRQITVDHHHGVIDLIAKATQDATAGGFETAQSAISTPIPFSGGVGEYLQMLINQNSGAALNFLGGVNRSGVLAIEKLA